MNVNPFSYLIEKLKSKADKSDVVSKSQGGKFDNHIQVEAKSTTTAEKYTYLMVGNNTPKGTVGNATGIVQIYGDSDKVGQLLMSSGMTANRTYTFPNNSGTVALTSDITTHSINTEVAWGSSATISRNGTNSMLITGGREGYGFSVLIPNGTNEYVILSNVNSCLDSVSVVGNTITLTVRSSGYGSKCQIFVLWN